MGAWKKTGTETKKEAAPNTHQACFSLSGVGRGITLSGVVEE
jgi:hypothetical protein